MRVSQAARRQQGASMIEVLVAVLIVSLGVISMAGLLATATRLSKASELRAVASLLASDIGDRMKANVAAVKSKDYDLVDDFSVLDEAPAVDEACTKDDPCADPKDLAAQDLAEWKQSLYYALPSGSGYVAYDDVGGAVDVWVAWLDPQALADEFADVDGSAKCPKAFQDKDPQPRCMYFRVSL